MTFSLCRFMWFTLHLPISCDVKFDNTTYYMIRDSLIEPTDSVETIPVYHVLEKQNKKVTTV